MRAIRQCTGSGCIYNAHGSQRRGDACEHAGSRAAGMYAMAAASKRLLVGREPTHICTHACACDPHRPPQPMHMRICTHVCACMHMACMWLLYARCLLRSMAAASASSATVRCRARAARALAPPRSLPRENGRPNAGSVIAASTRASSAPSQRGSISAGERSLPAG